MVTHLYNTHLPPRNHKLSITVLIFMLSFMLTKSQATPVNILTLKDLDAPIRSLNIKMNSCKHTLP